MNEVNRREAAQTEGRAHERSEVAARRRDRRLYRVRRACATSPGRGVMPTAYPTHINVVPRRLPRMRQVKSVRGVTESLPSERCTNVVSSRRAAGAVKQQKDYSFVLI